MGTTTDASSLFSTCAWQKWDLSAPSPARSPGAIGNTRLAPISEGGHETAAATKRRPSRDHSRVNRLRDLQTVLPSPQEQLRRLAAMGKRA